MRTKGGKRGPKTATYQITSEARRLPPPSGLCNLETGRRRSSSSSPSDAQAAQLKSKVGKEISVKSMKSPARRTPGRMSEAGDHQVERRDQKNELSLPLSQTPLSSPGLTGRPSTPRLLGYA